MRGRLSHDFFARGMVQGAQDRLVFFINNQKTLHLGLPKDQKKSHILGQLHL